MTEHEIPTTLAKNVDFLHGMWHLPKHMPELNISPVAELLTSLVGVQNQPLNELTAISDKQLGLKSGTSLKVAYYLLSTRQWHIDMNVLIDPDQPLTLLGTDLKVVHKEE